MWGDPILSLATHTLVLLPCLLGWLHHMLVSSFTCPAVALLPSHLPGPCPCGSSHSHTHLLSGVAASGSGLPALAILGSGSRDPAASWHFDATPHPWQVEQTDTTTGIKPVSRSTTGRGFWHQQGGGEGWWLVVAPPISYGTTAPTRGSSLKTVAICVLSKQWPFSLLPYFSSFGTIVVQTCRLIEVSTNT